MSSSSGVRSYRSASSGNASGSRKNTGKKTEEIPHESSVYFQGFLGLMHLRLNKPIIGIKVLGVVLDNTKPRIPAATARVRCHPWFLFMVLSKVLQLPLRYATSHVEDLQEVQQERI
ncbi:hypothetical protein NDU88_008050 [Pleurodeles waltl]|uniref:Uncharacterized protein n=1 Tax=Pleurodeles waltl TaxID=8319 RepID=A0AAV7QQP6_PLEWA|nr:hypothetical protein NDU88_008050 [Pleurodeles waltl]